MRLPPLIAVRFFEATARHASVRRAAEELHVTPGAVSQQVRKLEAFLGCALFERQPRGLALTAAGRDYQAACAEGLAVIGHATSRIASTNRRHAVLVSCTPGFAVQWLVPRLHGFLELHPDMDVHVGSTNRAVDLAAEGVHFAVRHGQGVYPGLKSEVLVADDLVPVCSPRLLAPRKTARVADITSTRLLHDEHRGDWRLWCKAHGVANVDCEGASSLRTTPPSRPPWRAGALRWRGVRWCSRSWPRASWCACTASPWPRRWPTTWCTGPKP